MNILLTGSLLLLVGAISYGLGHTNGYHNAKLFFIKELDRMYIDLYKSGKNYDL